MKQKTMNDYYGDGSKHIVCQKCGFCYTCNDCKCINNRAWECKLFGHKYVDNIIKIHDLIWITVQTTCAICNRSLPSVTLMKGQAVVWGKYDQGE